MQKSSINAQKNTAFSACCLSKGPPFTENPLLPCLKKRNQSGVFLCEIGTDTAKRNALRQNGGRLLRLPTKPRLNAIRFPDNPDVFYGGGSEATGSRRSWWRNWLTENSGCYGMPKDVVTKRWIVLSMPVQRYGCLCSAGNWIWRRWRHQGKAKSRIPRTLEQLAANAGRRS
ncbi:terminase [Salmonella enterica subsp. arizonae]|nr:terminase [Salmonella enterica subsp. arizonae]